MQELCLPKTRFGMFITGSGIPSWFVPRKSVSFAKIAVPHNCPVNEWVGFALCFLLVSYAFPPEACHPLVFFKSRLSILEYWFWAFLGWYSFSMRWFKLFCLYYCVASLIPPQIKKRFKIKLVIVLSSNMVLDSFCDSFRFVWIFFSQIDWFSLVWFMFFWNLAIWFW